MKSKLSILLLCLIIAMSMTACIANNSLAPSQETATKTVTAFATDEAYSDLSSDEIAQVIATAKEAISSATTKEAIDEAVSTAETTLKNMVLTKAKNTAKTEVEGYVTLTLYTTEKQAQITAKINEAKTAIDACTTKDGISAKVTEVKTAIDAIDTLAKEIAAAKAQVEGYADLTKYSEANKAQITAKINEAKTAIDALNSTAAIEKAVSDFKGKVDAIKTALTEAKESGKVDVEGYLKNVEENYSEEKQEEIANIIKDAKENIDKATSEAVIETIVSDAKEDLDGVLTITEEQEAAAKTLYDGMKVFYWNNDKGENIDSALTLDGSKIKIDAKDAGGTSVSFGTQDGKTSVVFDAYLTIDYRSTEWSSVAISFRAWDINSCLEMLIKDDVMTLSTVKWDSGKVTTLHTVNTKGGIKNNTEVHLQIICCGWTKNVLVNGESIFLFDANDYNVGQMFISTWQSGVTLRNPQYIEYASDDALKATTYGSLLWTKCVNKSETELLPEAKTSAKETIEGYITDKTVYSEANQAKIETVISEGKTAIDACTTTLEVSAKLAEIKASLDKIPTAATENAKVNAFKALLTNVYDYDVVSKMTVADGKIVSDTKQEGLSTNFKFGEQSGNMNKAFDTYMTIHYNAEGSGVIVRFCAWDTNACFKMVINQSGIKIYWSYWDQTNKTQTEVLLNERTTGIADGQEFHLQIITKGWTKMVLIDGECLLNIWPNAYHEGYTMIETWEAGIELRESVYKKYDSEDAVKADYGTVMEGKAKTCQESITVNGETIKLY